MIFAETYVYACGMHGPPRKDVLGPARTCFVVRHLLRSMPAFTVHGANCVILAPMPAAIPRGFTVLITLTCLHHKPSYIDLLQ